jgi:hypothetical protein
MLPNDVSQETRTACERESASDEGCQPFAHTQLLTHLRNLGFMRSRVPRQWHFFSDLPVSRGLCTSARSSRDHKNLANDHLGPWAEGCPGTLSSRTPYAPLLRLLTPPVPGHAPRLVHVQHQDHEQHHCAANGVG